MWTSRVGECTAGVSWEWIEWEPEVPILADPMSVVSNMSFGAGSQAWDGQRAVQLNTLIHELPWQQEVLRALREQRGSAKGSSRGASDGPGAAWCAAVPAGAAAVRGAAVLHG